MFTDAFGGMRSNGYLIDVVDKAVSLVDMVSLLEIIVNLFY